MLKELLVSQDHLSTAVASQKEITLDISASHAQLDKLLIQITWTNVLLSKSALNCLSDYQETAEIVVDANNVTSHHRSLIKPELDVSQDQRPTVIAFREDLTMDTLASHAQLEWSEMYLIQTSKDVLTLEDAILETVSNLLSIKFHVEDAKSAHWTRFQT